MAPHLSRCHCRFEPEPDAVQHRMRVAPQARGRGHERAAGMTAYSHLFTRCYDPLLARAEANGMGAIRQQVLSDADGRTLEIGAGTGLNLPHYPPDLTSLTLTDPEMIRALDRRAHRLDSRVEITQAPADRLPFPDESFDTVVSTLVLCTVPDVFSTLREVSRVLAPSGQLLLVEHVRASGAQLARWQDRLRGPWQAIAYGCRCNRDTANALTRAGFDVSHLRPGRWRSMPPIVRPLIVGRSIRTGGPSHTI